MARPGFHCTVRIDVLRISADITQVEVCFFIVERFEGITIPAIQFVGTVAKVTSDAEATKRWVLQHESVVLIRKNKLYYPGRWPPASEGFGISLPF